MEVLEFRSQNGTVSCTHYLKSKISKEAHGFKFGGQRLDDILNALGKKNVRSFKMLKNNTLQINYFGGKVYIRNFSELGKSKAFRGIINKVDEKSLRYGDKITALKMKKHPEWKNFLRHKANRPKSVANFNKKVELTKREQISIKFDGNTPVCTLTGKSHLTNLKYGYTYDGQAAANTISNIATRKVDAFQLQKDKSMELTTSKGNVILEDYNHTIKGPGMKKIAKNIDASADKMSQKEFNRRIKPITSKTAFLNKGKSMLNTGKKVLLVGVVGATLLVGAEKAGITPSFANLTSNINSYIEKVDLPSFDISDIAIETSSEVSNENKVVKEVAYAYENRTDSDKYQYVKDNFDDVIQKYSKMYGLDPNIVTAIATQENGYNANSENMAAAGLMQIEKSVWANKMITAYNHETGKMEDFFLEKGKMADLDTNVKAGCMILERSMRANDYDVLRGIAGYNMGGGNMSTIYKEAAKQTGKSVDEVKEDGTWLEYTYAPGVGDKNYVPNISSYLPDDVDSVYVLDKDGVKHEIQITNTYEVAKTR